MSAVTYPDHPGFKTDGTSREAAEAASTTASNLRARVLRQMRRAPAGLTADEAASALKCSVLSIRPRVSELNRMGEIVKTGERRMNASGLMACVWKAKD